MSHLAHNAAHSAAVPTFEVIKPFIIAIFSPNHYPQVRHMSNLVEVDVSSNNHLFNISNITTLKKLKYLKLRSCNLHEIDDLMELTTLVWLDVSNNKIVRIPKEIVNLVKLTYFYVRYNRLSALPEEILSLPELNYISVEGRFLDPIDSDHVFFGRHPYIRGAFTRQILVEPKQETGMV